MGMPMVRRLLEAGRDVTVFARRREVRDVCALAGAAVTPDIRAAVREVDAVLVCLFADAQVLELALGPDGFIAAMRPGATLIVHTTGSPVMTRTLAEHGADRDIPVVEAPVSGSAQDVAEGRVTVLLGGAPADLEPVRAIVGAYGDPILTIGPLGSALAVKLLNNALFAAQLQLAGDVERVAAGFGVDMGAVAEAIQHSSGSSYAMGVVERFGSLASVVAAAGHFLQKDVALVTEVALDLDLDLGMLGQVNRDGPLRFLARGDVGGGATPPSTT